MSAADTCLKEVVDYVLDFGLDKVSTSAADSAKNRIADVIAAALAALQEDVVRRVRDVCTKGDCRPSVPVLATAARGRPDLVAFVNATTARSLELNDAYHKPHTSGGHPSDVVMPLLAIAEFADLTGDDFLAAVILGYEIYLRFVDISIPDSGFDSTSIAVIAVAAASAWLLGLSAVETSAAVSIAAVSGSALDESRRGDLSMWKAAAAGEAGRAGVFASLLAQQGVTAPPRPFEGTHGWFRYVRRPTGGTSLLLGGGGAEFKVSDSVVKLRPAAAVAIPAIIAAERVAADVRDAEIEAVHVETYGRAVVHGATGEHHWRPMTRETADHSIPYAVAAALCYGRVGLEHFTPQGLADPRLRTVMATVSVAETAEFTAIYEAGGDHFPARVSIGLAGGQHVVGEAGDVGEGLTRAPTRDQMTEKFIALASGCLDPSVISAVLQRIWALHEPRPIQELTHLLTGTASAAPDQPFCEDVT